MRAINQSKKANACKTVQEFYMNSNFFQIPKTEQQLLQNCSAIAGQSLSELAALCKVNLPEDLKFSKGLTGQLLEKVLGATAGNAAEPDFQDLSIELKTIPVDINGKPRETTYVCTVPLLNSASNWEQSWVRRKLNRVLWLPIEADPQIPLANRRIGMGFLWSPSEIQSIILQQDWEELMQLITTGQFERITAKIGTYLQIRPKAANSKTLTKATNELGVPCLTTPRGFYLRTQLTDAILQQAFILP
ncbi:DNA mismatch repair endonuclease MutH [hydrothermal vent metagenome]|uniref:DNA mismatch repair endonuclease MutH n=1 Tax=hydrothermal vent metagenome TaxID=652676 RepID=A0A3B1AVC1_9ZZZZ